MKNLNTMKKAELIDLINELVAKNEQQCSVEKSALSERDKVVKELAELHQRFHEYCEAEKLRISKLNKKIEELNTANLDLKKLLEEYEAANNKYKKTSEEIASNSRAVKKAMSEKQLKALINITASYEVTLNIPDGATVSWASNEIQNLNSKIHTGTVKARAQQYNPEELLKKFIDKYPEIYADVINRNL